MTHKVQYYQFPKLVTLANKKEESPCWELMDLVYLHMFYLRHINLFIFSPGSIKFCCLNLILEIRITVKFSPKQTSEGGLVWPSTQSMIHFKAGSISSTSYNHGIVLHPSYHLSGFHLTFSSLLSSVLYKRTHQTGSDFPDIVFLVRCKGK